MITLAKYDLDFILPHIGYGKRKLTLTTKHGVFKVNANSDRLELFKRNHKCVTCNHTGSVFLLQTHIIGKRRVGIDCQIENCEWCSIHQSWDQVPGQLDIPHLNLYHVGARGGLILMTKDHIIPKCKGGRDHIDNLQTMCTVCNNNKGAHSFEAFAANGFKRLDPKKTMLM